MDRSIEINGKSVIWEVAHQVVRHFRVVVQLERRRALLHRIAEYAIVREWRGPVDFRLMGGGQEILEYGKVMLFALRGKLLNPLLRQTIEIIFYFKAEQLALRKAAPT